MQLGPVFGAVAVVMTARDHRPLAARGTRWLEGTAAAASIPSILGYIAIVTSHDEGLRGGRWPGSRRPRSPGWGWGLVAAGGLWALLGRNAFLLNAVLYGSASSIYRYGVTESGDGLPRGCAPRGRGAGRGRRGRRRARLRPRTLRRLLSSPSVWLLAPTWIARERVHRRMDDPGVFQLVDERRPGFADQLLMGGFEPTQVSIGLGVALVVFFAGLFFWGNRFRRYRRTTIIGHRHRRRPVMVGAVFGAEPLRRLAAPARIGLGAGGRRAGCSCSPARRPPRSGMLADISEKHPADRGAIMGLYSVFLASGRSSAACPAAAPPSGSASTACCSSRPACCSSPSSRCAGCAARSTSSAAAGRRTSGAGRDGGRG